MEAKKIFTRLCLNNWGGINHKILEFHEYVNLFSGKSGSGKSTVMDALQVILYGSFSPNFLNKAADDAKNRRSVLSYLRGEQKDGTANRAGQDFYTTIVLEILDTGTKQKNCVGIAFEVRKTDSELKKWVYFSHCGPIPEDEYLTPERIPYSNKQVQQLVKQREASEYNKEKINVNRIYPSKEAYTNALYDCLLGGIDGARFCTMEKSAIALKMTNGTGQFIRDYMFPKNNGDIVEKISNQLGAYRDIKEKIEDLKKRISYLQKVQKEGRTLTALQQELEENRQRLRCLDILELQGKIAAREEVLQQLAQEMQVLNEEKEQAQQAYQTVQEALIKVSADLKSSDLGVKEQQLKALRQNSKLLEENQTQWELLWKGLHQWGENPLLADYVSNALLLQMKALEQETVTVEAVDALRERIELEKADILEEAEQYEENKRATKQALQEKKQLVEDIRQNRKSYPERLRQARATLERRLSEQYGRTIKVQIFADLFDVKDEEWKNAVEGRLGRLRISLITEPHYAQDAAELFRAMPQYQEIHLIHSKALLESEPKVLEHSLYEAVETDEAYVDACLRRYLGRIIKCYTVAELEQVQEGVTPDCYSYSNFTFRHLPEKDYTLRACIGRKVSKKKLQEYVADVERLEQEYKKLQDITEQLRAVQGFECLRGDSKHIVSLSHAKQELQRVEQEAEELERVIANLRQGEIHKLEEQEAELKQQCRKLDQARSRIEQTLLEKNKQSGQADSERNRFRQELEEAYSGYHANEKIREQIEAEASQRSIAAVRSALLGTRSQCETKLQQQKEALAEARNAFIFAYPSCGFHGQETSNEDYEALLEQYEKDYEPQYETEFANQCNVIYRSLRENVIATIHGDIKAAQRQARDINRLLRETNFSDSTYQIKIGPAENENGQFYEMLMASELDTKNIDNDGFEGQLSLGEEDFYQKYAQQIQLLTDKFMPIREGDEHQLRQRKQEMEQYADYRNYLSFHMYEQVTDEDGTVIRENYVDEMAGRDSGGEGQNPKYVALLAGFAMLYMQQGNRDSKIKLVLLDEAFSKMDQERSAVCLKYARKMQLQLIVCVPDERLQSLIRNVDSVYGFRRFQNQISMMHIDKGAYLEKMEGNEE